MILPNGTTVAVVDGETLRLFRNKAHEPGIDLVALDRPAIDHAKRGSGGRHRSSSANPDRARLAEDAFAAAATDYLNRQAVAGAFSRLVVVADPRTLGEMRRHYHEALVSRLAGDIALDLAGRDKDAIEAALRRA